MLAARPRPRKRSARDPFRAPPWDDGHPAMRRIDPTLPPDHPARWLRRVVDRLDLTAFRLGYAGYGSPAYPVELLLAFVLFLYSRGTLSPAEWARRARHDDQCKWLLCGLQPSRSLLYHFRDRAEPFLDDWHRQLITWAVAEGVTTAARASLDGSFVAALASRHQLMSPRRLDRRLLLLRLLVWLDGGPAGGDLGGRLEGLPDLALAGLGLWAALAGLVVAAVLPPAALAEPSAALLGLLALVELLHPDPAGPWRPRLPAWVPASAAGRRRVLARHEDAGRRLQRRLEPYRRKKKLSKKDQQAVRRLKVSLTDPEAALGWDKVGTYRPLYNLPLVQATDAPLTLAWDVLPRNNDDGLLKPMMDKAREQLGHHLAEVLVDGGFVTVGEVAWCEREGVTVYAPPGKARSARAEVAEAAGAVAPAAVAGQPAGADEAAPPAGGGAGQEKIPKEAFRYDSVGQVYHCPQGKRLEVVARTTVKRQSGIELPMVVHRASGQDCQACPQQRRCTSNPSKGRTVKRYEGEEALERLEQRMAQPASRQVYRLRCRTVELGYADVKEHRGLRVFRCFGIRRARAQAGLVLLASNGLNILRALHRRQTPAQQAPPTEKEAA
jgi:transposase